MLFYVFDRRGGEEFYFGGVKFEMFVRFLSRGFKWVIVIRVWDLEKKFELEM